MPKRTPVPKNDAEWNVLTYRTYEEPLGKAFKRYSDMTSKGMMSKIANVLSAAGYDSTNGVAVMNRPADPSTVRQLEEIIQRAPDVERRRMMSKLYGDIGNGSLTVRKAIRDITEFGRYEHTVDLYKAGKDVLRNVAREGIMRGEFMVQKQVGLSWSMDVPGTKAVDTFLKGKWSQSSVTEYLRPMSKIVQDEVAKGLLMGDSPQKIANRWRNVEQINEVRATRNARTTVTAVANQAHADSYKRHGVKRYEFVATFDERTCIDCGKLDGKTYPIDSKAVGVNYPPIHPNCRCTTVAALSKELKEELYKNYMDNKGAEEMDPRMTYEEWAENNGRPIVPKRQPEPEKVVPKTNAREVLEKYNVEYRPVTRFKEVPTEEKIIQRVGGPDKTAGSCSSLALTYAGNKNGLDVLDYRDGVSRQVFSNYEVVKEISGISDGWIVKGKSDVKAAKELLDAHVTEGKEYYLATGRHAAIVRKNAEGAYEYLELQSTEEYNGFKPLGPMTLKQRFKCRAKGKYEYESVLIDIDNMKDNPEIEKLLGYINTKADKQVKGAGGYAK